MDYELEHISLIQICLDVDYELDVSDDNMTAAFCLTLPGKVLYLSPLLTARKFRNRGNKDGAVRAFLQLEEDGLGTTYVVGGTKQGGNQVSSKIL